MKESDLNSKLAYDITMGNFSLNLPTVKKNLPTVWWWLHC